MHFLKLYLLSSSVNEPQREASTKAFLAPPQKKRLKLIFVTYLECVRRCNSAMWAIRSHRHSQAPSAL